MPHPAVLRPLLQPLLLLCPSALWLVGCQTPDPVRIDASFAATPAFATRSPADIAVLPVEDGTADGGVQRHLVYLRQEIMRQLPDRRFSPLTTTTVDAAVRTDAIRASGDSILAPAALSKLVGRAAEDAVLAVRVDRWDESRLPTDKRVRLQFQAVLMGADGTLLWSGSLQGDIKAGGAGVAPLDRDGMARSCGAIAIHELLQRLPERVL